MTWKIRPLWQNTSISVNGYSLTILLPTIEFEQNKFVPHGEAESLFGYLWSIGDHQCQIYLQDPKMNLSELDVQNQMEALIFNIYPEIQEYKSDVHKKSQG